MEGQEKFYTAGIFAHRAGVTMKTIHYYDREGILSPSSRSESGYRLYNDEDFGRLQKILTLKFLGFSLEEIKCIIKSESENNNLKPSLEMQESIIDEKINHLKLVKKAIGEARHITDESNLDWSKFINIINVINMERTLLNQYKNSINLSARIRLHDRFSTNKHGWHLWLYDQLKLSEGCKVLELGCGNASLWARNIDRVPHGSTIFLTDLYDGMVEDARKTLGLESTKFNFLAVDAQNIPFENCSFDVIIANHMLYHVPDRDKALSEIYRVLKPGGRFYASTIGSNHLTELKSVLHEFDSDLFISGFDFSEEFGLETGMNQMLKFFSSVSLERYDDSLVITEAQPLIDYVCSTSGNTKEKLIADKLDSFTRFVQNKISNKGHIFITKDSGVFEGIK